MVPRTTRRLTTHSLLLLVTFGTIPTACGDDTAPPPPSSGGSGGTAGAAGEVGGEGGEPDAGLPDFPCAVRRAIEAKCQRCHTDPPENGAPFPLLTWDDTRAPYGLEVVHEAMLVAVESGFMPLTELPLSPPVEDLTPAEKATLVSWLRAGAPPDRSGAPCER